MLSKLGLGLAVHLLLGRYDDHVAYYTLERIFLERHAVVIPRQQMVQWVAHIAFLLQPICRLMFEQMKQGGYLQVDETPVKVMDPEVKGKCARGYLWFYAVPGGDVFLDFQDTRGRDAPHAQLANFLGTIQTDAYEVHDSLKKVIGDLVRIGCAAKGRAKILQQLGLGPTLGINAGNLLDPADPPAFVFAKHRAVSLQSHGPMVILKTGSVNQAASIN